MSGTLQVNDDSPAGLEQLMRLDTEHIVPRAGGRPHLGPLQQVRVDEHPQLLGVTERRHAIAGFGNSPALLHIPWEDGTMSSEQPDPVLVSVAAYSADPIAYELQYKGHLLDRPTRFASLLPPKAKILDLGCGPGRDIRLFTDAGHSPIGVELNRSFVAMASRHGHVIDADIRGIRDLFSPHTFDGIWAQASLVHLSRTETEQLLRNAESLLQPQGLFFACVPAVGETGWVNEKDGRRWYTVWPDDHFEAAVSAAGFEIDDVNRGPYVEVWARKGRR